MEGNSMYFITISEMLGTDGEGVARKVAKEMGYPFYGEEELFQAADEMGLLQDVKRLGEKPPTFFQRFFSEKPRIYLHRLQSVIYEIAKQGNAVFFGRGSQLLLRVFGCAFHVLIVGSFERRVRRLMEEKGISREIAEKMIFRSDQEKKGFIQYAFQEDWLNPNLYDLILNTDKLSIESASRMIIEGARSDEIKACGVDSVLSLKKLSLERQLEALFLEEGLSELHVFFTIENGETVRISGVVDEEEIKEKIERRIKEIKGIQKIINQLVVFKGPGGV